MAEQLRIEFAFGLPDEQMLENLELDAGATVADAIQESGVAARFPQEDVDVLQAGIWGRLVDRNHQLTAGDRVELYRPLERDPREARRDLATSGMTMRGVEKPDSIR